jgi:hypothetical protein
MLSPGGTSSLSLARFFARSKFIILWILNAPMASIAQDRGRSRRDVSQIGLYTLPNLGQTCPFLLVVFMKLIVLMTLDCLRQLN